MANQPKIPKYNLGLLETPGTLSDALNGNEKTLLSSASTSVLTTKSSSFRTNSKGLHTPLSSSSVTSRTPRSSRSCSSYLTSPFSDSRSANVVALVEGRGHARGEIGIAYINLKSPVLNLSQFSDGQTYVKCLTKLQIIQPVEIIMPNTAFENGNMTTLFKSITGQFKNTNVGTVQRKYFNEARGLQNVQELNLPDSKTVEMEIASKYYCLAACAALLKYIEFIQHVIYAPSSLRIVFQGSEKTTMIDAATAKNLELVNNLRDPKSEHSLFGVLKYTRTNAGSRLLRANILQPPCDVATITLRQDAVQEMTENEDIFVSLKSVLGQFIDINYLLTLFVQIPKQETIKMAESKIANVIYLKHTLELIEPLRLALKDAKNPLFIEFHKAMKDERFDQIMENIRIVINEDVQYKKGTLNMRIQKCFCVKPRINGLLDVSRRAYTERIDDISAAVENMAKDYNLPIKLACNNLRGFFIQVYCGGKNNNYTAESLPEEFIKVTKLKNTLSFTTTDLIALMRP